MNLLNILIVFTLLTEFNECINNEIEELKKEINYLGQVMLKRVTEFKEESAKDMEFNFNVTNRFMARLERDLDRANKNNAELILKFNQTINEISNNELFKKQAGFISTLI